MFGSMPFKYGKVGSESSSSTDNEEMHPVPGRSRLWTRIGNAICKLRWPSTYFLLVVILATQIQILHRQPASKPVGSEINGLVPICKSS
jgi:hypothetical protein